LWAFNEEVVADAIYEMQTPVVSAVGHEVDTLISDFVADVRAPTPSAAMEMILPDSNEILYTLDEQELRYKQIINGLLYDKIQKLNHQDEMIKRLSPSQKLLRIEDAFVVVQKQFRQVIDYKLEQFTLQPIKLVERLNQNITFGMHQKEQRLSTLIQSFKLNDPKLQTKDGWGQISKNGKKVSVKSLKEEDVFVLSDASTVVEAKVISKKKL
jgi:exodeoxyribonuclease VII large subunit